MSKIDTALMSTFDVDTPCEAYLPPSVVRAKEQFPIIEQNDLVKNEMEAENEEIRQTLMSDYDTARDNLLGIIDKADRLLETSIDIANATEDPKAIASATKLIDSLANLNERLVNLTKTKQDVISKTRAKEVISNALNGGVPNGAVVNNTQNNVFVGTPAELNRLINEARANNKQE